MKILHIVPCWPHEKAYGTQQRVLCTARALRGLGDVSMAVLQYQDPSSDVMEKSRREFLVEHKADMVLANRGLTERLRSLWDSKILNPYIRVVAEPARSRILGDRANFDLVWITQLKTACLFSEWAWPRTVLDIDDIPSAFERARVDETGGLIERLRCKMRVLVWRRRERLLGSRFGALAVCSEGDRRYLASEAPVHVVPNGFETPARPSARNLSRPPRIGFIGPMGYDPNADAVRWFIRHCWPHVKRAVPDCRFRLGGKQSEEDLNISGPDIDRLGWVADTGAEMESWSAMIVPIRSGAGTRVKIAEAFGRNCPVVSTRFGAYGYDVENGSDLLLEDEPEAFASACVDLVLHPEKGVDMAGRAWRKFLENWTWDSIAPKIHAAAEDCLRASK